MSTFGAWGKAPLRRRYDSTWQWRKSSGSDAQVERTGERQSDAAQMRGVGEDALHEERGADEAGEQGEVDCHEGRAPRTSPGRSRQDRLQRIRWSQAHEDFAERTGSRHTETGYRRAAGKARIRSERDDDQRDGAGSLRTERVVEAEGHRRAERRESVEHGQTLQRIDAAAIDGRLSNQ